MKKSFLFIQTIVIFSFLFLSACQNNASPDFTISQTEPISLKSTFPFSKLQLISLLKKDQQVLTQLMIGSQTSWNFIIFDLKTKKPVDSFQIPFPNFTNSFSTSPDMILSSDEKTLFLLVRSNISYDWTIVSFDIENKVLQKPISSSDLSQSLKLNIIKPSFAGVTPFLVGVSYDGTSVTRVVTNFLAPNKTNTFLSADSYPPSNTKIDDEVSFFVSSDQKSLFAIVMNKGEIRKYSLEAGLPLATTISLPSTTQGGTLLSSSISPMGRLLLLYQSLSQQNYNYLAEFDSNFSLVRSISYPKQNSTSWYSILAGKESPIMLLKNSLEPSVIYLESAPNEKIRPLVLGGLAQPLLSTVLLKPNVFATLDLSGELIGWSFSEENKLNHQIEMVSSDYKRQNLPITSLQSNLISVPFSDALILYQSRTPNEDELQIKSIYSKISKENKYLLNNFNAISALSPEALSLDKSSSQNIITHYVIFTGYEDGTIKGWDFSNVSDVNLNPLETSFSSLSTTKTNLGAITTVETSPSGGCFIAGNAKGQTESWCSPKVDRTLSLVKVISNQDLTGIIEQLHWSPDGKKIFGSDNQGNAVLWETIPTIAVKDSFFKNQSKVIGMNWLTSDTLVTIQQDGTLTLWDASSMSVVQQRSLGHKYIHASFLTDNKDKIIMLILDDSYSIQLLRMTAS